MPKLIKARYKAPDDLPEDFRCCPVMIASLFVGDFIVDMDTLETNENEMVMCPYCGYAFDAQPSVRRADNNKRSMLIALDLDEGEATNVQAN